MGATGSRTSGYVWVNCTDGEYPENAFEGGRDLDYRVYVARARHEGLVIPGKFHIRFKKCFIVWRGQELTITTDYDILVAKPGALRWVSASSGNIMETTVVGGYAEDGQPLYIGRTWFSYPQTPGPRQYPVFYGANQVVKPWIIPAPPCVLNASEHTPPFHRKILIPGQIQPNHCCCYVPWGGIEFRSTSYEILIQVCRFKEKEK